MRIPLFHVDAFADQPFRGNPAAVCLLNSWLDDASLLKVAAENNLSATAFLVRQTDRNELRWFTPSCEIKLCGHATMAAAYVVFEVLNFELQTVAFKTRFLGELTVNKNGDRLAMNLPLFVPEPCRDIPADLTKALGERMSPSEVLAVNDTFIAIFGDSRIIQSYEPETLIFWKNCIRMQSASLRPAKIQISSCDILLRATGFLKTPSQDRSTAP